jgi:hypothetical protein
MISGVFEKISRIGQGCRHPPLKIEEIGGAFKHNLAGLWLGI